MLVYQTFLLGPEQAHKSCPFDQQPNEKAGLGETSFCFMSVHFLLASFWVLVSNIQEGLSRPDLN